MSAPVAMAKRIHERYGEDRCRESADGSDGQVDLSEKEDAHDSECYHADSGALHQEVDEVGTREKERVQALEDGANDEEADDDREHAELPALGRLDGRPQPTVQTAVCRKTLVLAIEGEASRRREACLTHGLSPPRQRSRHRCGSPERHDE